MNFLIIDTSYPNLLEVFYQKNKNLIFEPFRVQKAAFNSETLGIAG